MKTISAQELNRNLSKTYYHIFIENVKNPETIFVRADFFHAAKVFENDFEVFKIFEKWHYAESDELLFRHYRRNGKVGREIRIKNYDKTQNICEIPPWQSPLYFESYNYQYDQGLIDKHGLPCKFAKEEPLQVIKKNQSESGIFLHCNNFHNDLIVDYEKNKIISYSENYQTIHKEYGGNFESYPISGVQGYIPCNKNIFVVSSCDDFQIAACDVFPPYEGNITIRWSREKMFEGIVVSRAGRACQVETPKEIWRALEWVWEEKYKHKFGGNDAEEISDERGEIFVKYLNLYKEGGKPFVRRTHFYDF